MASGNKGQGGCFDEGESDGLSGTDRRGFLKASGLVPLVPVSGLTESWTTRATERVGGGGVLEQVAGGQLVFSDDFEDGNLDGYEEIRYDRPGNDSGDPDVSGFAITSSPSVGQYAVSHQTEQRLLVPVGGISLNPPLEFRIDCRFTSLSGIDLVLQWDRETQKAYIVRVRSNSNGQIFALQKFVDPFYMDPDEESRSVKQDRTKNAGFSNNQWFELVVRWEADGTITAEVPSTGDSLSIQDTELGGNTFAIGGYHFDGTGYFDNVEVYADPSNVTIPTGLIWDPAADWDAAVSSGVVHEAVANTDHVDAGVVKQGYSVAAPYRSENLVLYAPMHEDSGNTAHDYSGAGRDGNINNATLGAEGLLGGSAYSFDGTDDDVNFGDVGAVKNVSAITVSIWLKTTALNHQHAIVSKGRTHDDGDELSWLLRFWPDPTRFRWRAVVNGVDYRAEYETAYDDGEWHHLVGTYDGSSVALFVDGVERERVTGVSGSISNSGEDLTVASFNSVDMYSDFTANQLMIWNAGFDQTDVSRLYDVATTPGTITTASKEAN